MEKVERELDAVAGALRRAEGADFPEASFEHIESQIADVNAFIEEQAERLEDKILHAGGLEPGRVRRSGGN